MILTQHINVLKVYGQIAEIYSRLKLSTKALSTSNMRKMLHSAPAQVQRHVAEESEMRARRNGFTTRKALVEGVVMAVLPHDADTVFGCGCLVRLHSARQCAKANIGDSLKQDNGHFVLRNLAELNFNLNLN